ncbi:hypothetical protein [Paenibacillus polymyxa]|uniref:hypothetical protein n=1 Tax=Paenibacillus polymyxa TaxID=1406 RepID=UPI001F33CE1F|nr:hypothetical protein [Paenibacillus polymyxa]
MANVNAAIEQLMDMRLELDDTIRLLGFDPEASDRQQAGTNERACATSFTGYIRCVGCSETEWGLREATGARSDENCKGRDVMLFFFHKNTNTPAFLGRARRDITFKPHQIIPRVRGTRWGKEEKTTYS